MLVAGCFAATIDPKGRIDHCYVVKLSVSPLGSERVGGVLEGEAEGSTNAAVTWFPVL